MTITLPDNVRAQAERLAHAAGFASVGENWADLVRKVGEMGTPPDQYAGRTREEFEALLKETLGTEPKTMDEAFWVVGRRKMLEYTAKRGITS